MSDSHTDTLHEIEELKKQVAALQSALDKLTQDNTQAPVSAFDEVATSIAAEPQPSAATHIPMPNEPQSPIAAPAPMPVQSAPVYGQVPVDSGYTANQPPVPPAGFNQAQYQATQQQWSTPVHNTTHQAPVIRHKDHVAAALLAIFLGGFGVHKFYLGYNTAGFIMLGVTLIGSILTFGFAAAVVWLIGLVEGIVYLVKTQDEFENLYIRNKREWF